MNIEDHPAARPLNRLLRMAVLAGTEAAVRLHIARGDDLDARDADGQTPLMLAAFKNKGAVCSLLISSGADLTLTDSLGRDALAIAKASGAAQAVAAIAAFLPNALETPIDDEIPPSCVSRVCPDRNQSVPKHEVPEDREESLDLSAWEAEQESEIPEGDDLVIEAVSTLHRAISGHKPVDDSEGWEGIEAYLPERATPLPRADDDEKRERLRILLLRAIRQSEIPDLEVAAICEKCDGSRNEDAEELLRLVLADVGCETGEWIETTERFSGGDINELEEIEIAEAMAFLDDLGSGHNEPFRSYIRDMRRGSLLTADEEILLGQNMEKGATSAISALAGWPQGVAAVLAAADRMKTGEADAESISRWTGGAFDDGPEAPLDEGESLEEEKGEEAHVEVIAPSAGAREFLERSEEIRQLAGNAGKGGVGEMALRGALASANLPTLFLAERVASAKKDDSEAAERFRQAIALYSQARERMTVSNLRLVISVVKHYQGLGLAFDDLVQEGNIGLMKAVERYDWRKGFRFSTYATWWIRQQARRAIADHGKTIRTPVHVHEKILHVVREVNRIERETGRIPSAEDIAPRLSMSPKIVTTLLSRNKEPVSINEPSHNGSLLEDVLIDTLSPDPFEIAERIELQDKLETFLAEMGQKMGEIIRLRFGLYDDETLTLEEVGGRFGVTRERIRQIESKALRWFSMPARAVLLRDYIEPVFSKPLVTDGKTKELMHDESEKIHPRDAQRIPLNSSDSKNLRGMPVRSAVDKVLTMARANGVPVLDRRSEGGEVVVLLFERKEAKSRSLARALVGAGFAYVPGMGFRR